LGAQETPLSDILPLVVDKWQSQEDVDYYSPDNLYEYINGGAELYISYGFEKVLNKNYTRAGHPEIIVDIFDMNNSKNAFGIFAHSREKIDETFGQGSLISKGMIMFWKDKYLVSILSYPETKESKKAINDLAREIDDNIKIRGPLPDILTLLPKESLVETSIRYFRHYIWLNSHFFIADSNILNINENSEALIAKYGKSDRRYALLLVKYSSSDEARLAQNGFMDQYMHGREDLDLALIEDGTWVSCRQNHQYLYIVFNAPSREIAVKLSDNVENKLKQK